MNLDASDFYKMEYEQCASGYRHTYQTIWAAGAVFAVASAAILGIGRSESGDIALSAGIVGPIPMLFWWLGIFRPMNRYAEHRSARLATLEEMLSETVPDLRMAHFLEDRKRRHAKVEGSLITRARMLRVSQVVNATGIALLALEAVLLTIVIAGLVS